MAMHGSQPTARATSEWSRAGDSCGFYALKQGESCRQPRSCYDCINVRVAAEPNGCFISPSSACESMGGYSTDMDYRRNDSSFDNGEIDNPTGGWFHMFPSSNSTYCEEHDPACLRCHEIAVNASKENSYLASTTKFCLGASGCVCIVGCESPTRMRYVQQECRNRPSSDFSLAASNSSSAPRPTPVPTASASTASGTRRLVWYFLVAQLFMFFVAICVRARWLRYRRRVKKTPAHQLQLSGWRAMHEELIERDRDRPAHVESVLHSALPPSVSLVISDSSSASPPLMTRTERSAWINANASRPPAASMT